MHEAYRTDHRDVPGGCGADRQTVASVSDRTDARCRACRVAVHVAFGTLAPALTRELHLRIPDEAVLGVGRDPDSRGGRAARVESLGESAVPSDTDLGNAAGP